MNPPVIRLEGLGKRYRLGVRSARYKTLRESLSSAFSPKAPAAKAAGTPGGETWIWALEDLTLDVPAGQVMGLVGRNGAGKSTLLKILSRITEPTVGSAEIRGRIGSLLEVGTGFHPELTGRENVYLNGAILGMRRREIDRQFDAIVEFAELAKFIDTAVKHYSTGMYMRLAFAVAAHVAVEILLVDEVLAVGDASFQKRCLGKMGEVAATGRTVIFVSHNMAALQDLCERAVWIDHGRTVADGPALQVTERYLTSLAADTFSYVNHAHGLAIRAVRLHHGDGRSSSTFAPGDDLFVDVDYEALQTVERPNFCLVVVGLEGPCFAANMLFDGHRPRALEGTGTVRCRFKSIPLMPQSYTLKLQIRTHDSREAIVAWQEVSSFNVAGDLADHGLAGEFRQQAARSISVMIPYEWTLPDGRVEPVEVKPAALASAPRGRIGSERS